MKADERRSVVLDRIGPSKLRVTNPRGGQITIGAGADTDFTPVELLLTAIGGCTAIDVDLLTSRRAEPVSFTVRVEGEKLPYDDGNRVDDIAVTFEVRFPTGPAGDEARAVLPAAVRRSHDRLCPVGRTVETPTSIATRID
jgi:uncharacterized OsmC-like protein